MSLKSADVFLDEIDSIGRDVQRGIFGKSQCEVFLTSTLFADRLNTRELGDAVRHMDDVVPHLQIQKRIDRPRGNDLFDSSPLLVTVKEFMMAKEHYRVQGSGFRVQDFLI